jgi:hypothetical protein
MENLLPESGFCWKKDRQDTIFLQINNSRKNTQKFIYYQKMKVAKRGERKEQ